jgi:hypothetical protein
VQAFFYKNKISFHGLEISSSKFKIAQYIITGLQTKANQCENSQVFAASICVFHGCLNNCPNGQCDSLSDMGWHSCNTRKKLVFP